MFTSLAVTDLIGARKLKRRFDAVLTLQDRQLKRGELLRFARQPAPQHLRSGAMAFALMAEALRPGCEEQALGELLAQRPIIVPSGRVVMIADKVMGCGGALVAVYRHRLAKNWVKMRPDLFPTHAVYEQMRNDSITPPRSR